MIRKLLMSSLEKAYLTTFFLNSLINIGILKNANSIDYIWEIIGICILMIFVGITRQITLQTPLKRAKHYCSVSLKQRLFLFLVKIKMTDSKESEENGGRNDGKYEVVNFEKAG